MLSDDIEKMRQLLDTVKFEQPALKDEKPTEDTEAEDVGLEPVNFNKKADSNHGMDKVSDEDLEPTKLEDGGHSTMPSVTKSTDILDPEDKKLMRLAVEQGLISAELPSMSDMADALVDTNLILSGSIYADVYQKYIAGKATLKDMTKLYIKGVLLPVLRNRPSKDGDAPNESTLHVCNACTKVFRASETKCTGCKSENTELVIKEDGTEFDSESLGIDNSPPKFESVEGLTKAIEDTIKEWDVDDEKTKRHVIGRGLDQQAAEDLAREKQGQAVPDDEDEDKTGKVFMVITKEKPNVQ